MFKNAKLVKYGREKKEEGKFLKIVSPSVLASPRYCTPSIVSQLSLADNLKK